ncbi:glycosyltransferase [Mycobacterium sp. 236(2023)]|uniref:glycosyltransferase n=1 Tax=Mycobacterium sp. 236(2023) TaxID=3038163 RepID=UPI0024157FA9|nr:glycosyltransferase [Mycobacterium sp. 236(2023)]MDG4664847.1 glycosyltransferase [Mycobacterium sp. 236(2023)]
MVDGAMIGYYVHHHGRGHLTRALAICAHLDEPVIFFSSLPRPPALCAPDTWVQLPDDVPDTGHAVHDVTANGRLHWAPAGLGALTRRCADILHILAAMAPRLLVVDVSVEVAVLARVAGVPVVVMAQPGNRSDPAHVLGYDIAERIIACWSEQVYRPQWLDKHSGKTQMVGAISRFDGACRPEAPSGRPAGLLLAGAGGSAVPADALIQLRTALPQYEWSAAGGYAAWVDNPWPQLASADFVVTHAGQNALADTALARAAAIVIPEARPFDEQHAMASALSRGGVAAVAPEWPAPDRWPALAEEACAIDRGRWDLLEVRGAAARAAAAIAA